MKNFLKYLICLSFSVVLLLAGQACKKTTAKTAEQLRQDSIARADSLAALDFRTALVGAYTCELHSSSWEAGSPSHDTIIRIETINVEKSATDTNVVVIAGRNYTYYSLNDTTFTLLDLDFCRPLPAYLDGHNINCEIDHNCSGQGGGYSRHYLGHKTY